MLFHVRNNIRNLIKLERTHQKISTHQRRSFSQYKIKPTLNRSGSSSSSSCVKNKQIYFSSDKNHQLSGIYRSFRLSQVLASTLFSFKRLLSKRSQQIVQAQVQNRKRTLGRTFFVFSFLGFSFGGSKTEDPLIKRLKMASQELNEVLQHADQLFDENNFKGAIELLKSFPDQNQYDIKWRLARALYSAAKSEDSKTKDQMIREGYEHAKDALSLKDDDYAGHKWMAVLLDSKSGLDGIKTRVEQLENVKKHMQKAVELNPEDPTSWYILGEFAFGLAELPWYTRKIVSAIFANPPSGTFEEALEYFEKAENLKNGFYSMNYLMLGKCYYHLNNKEKAKEWLTKAANVTVNNEDDKKCKEEGAKLLKKV